MSYTINSKEQLQALLKQKPKTVSQKICPVCQHKIYRIFVKGVEKWMGCKCARIKAHHYI